MTAYLGDVAALAHKDLRLELRARDTLPAMVLFVVATLVVFHFALPGGASDDAAYGLLWVALVFTALLGLGRAWVPEGEAGALDGLVLATSDRSAIWLGKTLATLAFLGAAEVVALPAFALFFARLDGAAIAGVVLASIGICAVGSLVSARPRPREVARSCSAPVPATRNPARRRWRRIEHFPRPGHLPGVPGPLRRRLRDTFLGGVRVRRHRVSVFR